MDAFDISASGMTAQRLRLDVIAGNLANINTTRKADGSVGVYRHRNVVFAPILDNKMRGGKSSLLTSNTDYKPEPGVQVTFENGEPTLKAKIKKEAVADGTGVMVSEVVEDFKTPLKLVFDPSHPDADAEGYVSLPNINPVTEMVDMISATRAYEANVSAIQATKSLGRSALEI